MIAQAASRVGFAGGIVVDYPNSTKAKKVYLCLSFERSYQVPRGLINETADRNNVNVSGRMKKENGGYV
jgi:18S rRNA (guanine1575-N7)-methyltransferase